MPVSVLCHHQSLHYGRDQQITVLKTSHSACNSDVRANAPLPEEAILMLLPSGLEGVSVVSLLQKMRSVRLEVTVPFTRTAEEQYVLMCFDTFAVCVCVH